MYNLEFKVCLFHLVLIRSLLMLEFIKVIDLNQTVFDFDWTLKWRSSPLDDDCNRTCYSDTPVLLIIKIGVKILILEWYEYDVKTGYELYSSTANRWLMIPKSWNVTRNRSNQMFNHWTILLELKTSYFLFSKKSKEKHISIYNSQFEIPPRTEYHQRFIIFFEWETLCTFLLGWNKS